MAIINANNMPWVDKYTPSREELDEAMVIAERKWRDEELSRTDTLILLPDYPDKESLTVYRKALREYPAQVGFPNATRPVIAPVEVQADFDAMTKKEIDTWADTQGIDVDGRLSKADMIKFVNAELAKK